MEEYNITLTEREIEVLQIALCASKIALENDIDNLKNHNKTGINTNKITQKIKRIKDCDELFTKLHKANIQ